MAEIDFQDEIPVTGGRTRSHFNISNFRTEVYRRDVLPTHSYLVTLSPFSSTSATASNLSSFLRDHNDSLVMRCDSAILPGINVMTDANVRRYGYGPVEHMAHGVSFQEVALTWVVDRRGAVVKFFNDWLHTIVNFNSYGGSDMTSTTQIGSLDFSPYEVGYKDDYSNYKLSIYVYDRSLNTVMEYQIFDVFPRQVMDVPLHWGEQDNVIRLNVLFAFTDIKIVNSDLPTFENLISNIPAVFENNIGNFFSPSIPLF